MRAQVCYHWFNNPTAVLSLEEFEAALQFE